MKFIKVQTGADVTVKDGFIALEIWGVINPANDKGFIIDGIKSGDIITIESLSGICSFEESSSPGLASCVGIAGGLMKDLTSYYAGETLSNTESAVERELDSISNQLKEAKPHKRRDGFGQDPKSGDFAKHEGGLIVCMPSAGGAIYATPENYLSDNAKKHGRLETYFSGKIQTSNSFFPCNLPGGIMHRTAKKRW